MRVPIRFLIHERWVACVYNGNSPWFYSGWTLRHACGKYSKVNLEHFKQFEAYQKTQYKPVYLDHGWKEGDVKTISAIPVVFGNKMRRAKRRAPKGVCPRCGEKVPGGLAIWVTTESMRGER